MARKFRPVVVVDSYTRRGYRRRGYTRKDGTKVSPAYVHPARVKRHKMRVWKLAKNQKPVNPHVGREKRKR